jgi:hypothetical protein
LCSRVVDARVWVWQISDVPLHAVNLQTSSALLWKGSHCNVSWLARLQVGFITSVHQSAHLRFEQVD